MASPEQRSVKAYLQEARTVAVEGRALTTRIVEAGDEEFLLTLQGSSAEIEMRLAERQKELQVLKDEFSQRRNAVGQDGYAFPIDGMYFAVWSQRRDALPVQRLNKGVWVPSSLPRSLKVDNRIYSDQYGFMPNPAAKNRYIAPLLVSIGIEPADGTDPGVVFGYEAAGGARLDLTDPEVSIAIVPPLAEPYNTYVRFEGSADLKPASFE